MVIGGYEILAWKEEVQTLCFPSSSSAVVPCMNIVCIWSMTGAIRSTKHDIRWSECYLRLFVRVFFSCFSFVEYLYQIISLFVLQVQSCCGGLISVEHRGCAKYSQHQGWTLSNRLAAQSMQREDNFSKFENNDGADAKRKCLVRLSVEVNLTVKSLSEQFFLRCIPWIQSDLILHLFDIGVICLSACECVQITNGGVWCGWWCN